MRWGRVMLMCSFVVQATSCILLFHDPDGTSDGGGGATTSVANGTGGKTSTGVSASGVSNASAVSGSVSASGTGGSEVTFVAVPGVPGPIDDLTGLDGGSDIVW